MRTGRTNNIDDDEIERWRVRDRNMQENKYIKMRSLLLSVCETNNQPNAKVSFCYAPTIVMNSIACEANKIDIMMPKRTDEHS